MASAIEEVIRRCTDPLREDWTLRQEVAQELRSHLEEKYAELRLQGLSPEECEARAVRCFGGRKRSARDCFAPISTGCGAGQRCGSQSGF